MSTPDQCHLQPSGWKCTRKAGHLGACAAVPDEEFSPTPRTDAIDAKCDEHESYPRGPYQMLCRKLERELAEKDAQIAAMRKQSALLRSMLADERNHAQHVVDSLNAISHAKPEQRNKLWHELVHVSRGRMIWPDKVPPPVVPLDDVRPLVEAAYVHNQNMHCYATKGRLNDELNAQTMVLREARKKFSAYQPQTPAMDEESSQR